MGSQWTAWRVAAKAPESEVITSFHLVPEDHGDWRAFKPGQFLTLRLGAEDEQALTQPLIRYYSLSGSPLQQDAYRISVKREGAGSIHLHDRVQVGDVLQVQGPRGAFVLDQASHRPVVLLSGGVGLTPMVSMMHALAPTGRTAFFIHACESAGVHAFRQEVNALVQGRPHLHAHYVYRQARPEDLANGHCHSAGLISRALLQSLLPLDDYEAYLCGPPGFMQANYALLRELGLAKERIAYEFFGPATVLEDAAETVAAPPSAMSVTAAMQAEAAPAEAPSETATGGQPVVRFATSALERAWTSDDKNLLDFAEACGLNPSFSCRAGVCGSCSTRLLSGQVRYTEEPLEPPAEGHVLLCCAQPCGPVTLDL
ncbi:MAG: 2Fe-2S iron-sulfur cluster-binding protein [Comamonadaceae bacterium]|nr:2Fe-2S iron-sulfur cluster-binding protein [Comamonadaceae bacterium]